MSAAAAAAPSDDTIPINGGTIALHAIHHAALTLTWNGLVILVDPAPPQGGTPPADPTAEYKALPAPQLILLTHDHPDHFNVPILQAVSGGATIVAPKEVFAKMPADLQAKTKVMANGDTATIDNVAIEAFPMYNTTARAREVPPRGRRQRLHPHHRRKAHLHRRRYRGDPGNEGAHRHRRRLPADEPALHHGHPARRAGGEGF
ncbi:MAG: MBL fold metallo-hydrolase [Bauldia sp.]